MSVNPLSSSLPGFYNDELQEIMEQAKMLLKIEMKVNDDGDYFPLTNKEAIRILEGIPQKQRRQAIAHVLDLVEQGLPAAADTCVLKFFANTPEDLVNTILRVGKGAFFDKSFKVPFIFIFIYLEQICTKNTFSEEQLIAFGNLKASKIEECGLKERFIYKVLFGGQDCLRNFAFEQMRGNESLFQFVKKSVLDTPLQTHFEQWLLKHPEVEKEFQKDEEYRISHREYNQTWSQLKKLNFQIQNERSQHKYQSFFQNAEKPFPKNLILRHPRSTKEARGDAKKTVQKFLDILLENGKNVEMTSNHSVFKLNKDNYRVSLDSNVMTLIKNDGKGVALDHSESDALNYWLLAYTLNGNRLERAEVETSLDKMPNDYWHMWESASENMGTYQYEIDPMICSTVQKIFLSKFWLDDPVILDVGGGRGRLAESLTKLARFRYILLEKNQAELNQAKETLGARAKVHETDILNDPFPVSQATVDIAIASGVLAHLVLKDKEEALIALKKVCAAVKPRGFILLTGKTSSFITAKDFIEEGFDVINTSLPRSHRHFYIARKKDIPLAAKLNLDSAALAAVEEVLSALPSSEREDAIDHLLALQKIQMRDQGVLIPPLTLLKAISATPASRRASIVSTLLDWFSAGVAGANEKAVLDYLVQQSTGADFHVKMAQARSKFAFSRYNEHQEILLSDSKIKIDEGWLKAL